MKVEKDGEGSLSANFEFKAIENLKSYLYKALNMSIPVALWQLPGSDIKHLAINFTKTSLRGKINLESSKPGFAVSPFINPQNNLTYFIEADLYYSSNGQILWNEISSEKFDLRNEFLSYEDKSLEEYKYAESNKQTSKIEYINSVSKAIEEINHNTFKKVVLARGKEVSLKKNFDLFNTFLNLSREYLNAFVSLFFIPEAGTWMGVSPELLAETNKEIFKTISLAGTQMASSPSLLSEAVWTQKEIEEQALVSRYIINCFKSIRLREYEEEGPRTVSAGNLIHLQTDYKVNKTETGFPELGTTMLELLHPTSAVCGMPKKEALEFIERYEKVNRKLYAGFLGPVNIKNQSNIFVNLRCAEFYADKAYLYAGAGITKDSNPEKEWEETEIKMKSLENFL